MFKTLLYYLLIHLIFIIVSGFILSEFRNEPSVCLIIIALYISYIPALIITCAKYIIESINKNELKKEKL